MQRIRIPNGMLVGLLLLLGGSAGFLSVHFRKDAPQERSFTITGQKYAYDPPIIHVNQGDRVRILLVAKDVTHGFYLEGYDLDAKARPEDPGIWVRRPSRKEGYQEVEEINFVANRTGKFRYRCSQTCGYMHPFMQGELIVRPNYLFPISLGSLVGLAVGMLATFRDTNGRGQGGQA
jgi:heme/copper-type cytochrome/quinol oxidase subunit 2